MSREMSDKFEICARRDIDRAAWNAFVEKERGAWMWHLSRRRRRSRMRRGHVAGKTGPMAPERFGLAGCWLLKSFRLFFYPSLG